MKRDIEREIRTVFDDWQRKKKLLDDHRRSRQRYLEMAEHAKACLDWNEYKFAVEGEATARAMVARLEREVRECKGLFYELRIEQKPVRIFD